MILVGVGRDHLFIAGPQMTDVTPSLDPRTDAGQIPHQPSHLG